ncbi:MAG: hypothetical protein Q8P48_04890 [Deltaproteobacteria bacterium]|nr:hypothetical protein [Deltaproteobacteria bacterium]
MSNFDTVSAITENIQAILNREGVFFSRKSFDDRKSIPASLFPLGRIFYAGESFEYSHGQKPLYAEVEYTIRVELSEKDPYEMMREQQRWAHCIRGALTVDALNTGELAASKHVSRVVVAGVEADNGRNASSLILRTIVRYRES